MPYGFYITDKGRELLTASTNSESKVEITKACFGSGGSPETEKDYSITELKNQFYEKTFEPEIDSYKLSSVDPTELCIETIVPSEVSGTINEIGYKDSSDNLIIYGVVREREKLAGSDSEGYQLKYENWIKVANADIDKIEIKVQSPEVGKLTDQISQVESTVSDLESTVSGFEGSISSLESGLEGVQNSITNFDSDYVKQTTYNSFISSIPTTYTKTSDFNSLKQRVQELETALEGVDILMESLI